MAESIQSSNVPLENENDVIEKYIRDIAGGDKGALASLYQDTYASVYGFALSVLKNPADAEDVQQEVYVKIWQAAADYTPMGKPMAWIFTITRSQALMALRQKNRTTPVAPEAWESLFSGETDADAEDRTVMSAVMDQLEEDERQIVILHAAGGLKHREIATLLGMKLSTVLSRYSRALQKLRRALEEG